MADPISVIAVYGAAAKVAGAVGNAKKLTGWLSAWRDDRRAARTRRAAESLAAQLSVLFDTEPATATAIEAVRAEAPAEAEDVLFEYFENHMNRLEPTAEPYITRLAASYFAHRLGRDTFFRRAGRMLVDATAAEIEQIVLMFSLTREAIGAKDATSEVGVSINTGPAPDGGLQSTVVISTASAAGRESAAVAASLLDGIASIKQSGLLQTKNRGPGSPADGPGWLVFEPADFAVLNRLMRLFVS